VIASNSATCPLALAVVAREQRCTSRSSGWAFTARDVQALRQSNYKGRHPIPAASRKHAPRPLRRLHAPRTRAAASIPPRASSVLSAPRTWTPSRHPPPSVGCPVRPHYPPGIWTPPVGVNGGTICSAAAAPIARTALHQHIPRVFSIAIGNNFGLRSVSNRLAKRCCSL